jgi:Acetyltransferase (GNAT) domain
LISTDPVVSSGKALHVFEMNFREDSRWKEFIYSHPDALIYHHPAWLTALESEYGQKCICLACEDEAGQLCAILPLLYTRGLPIKFGRMATGKRLSSLPRTPIAGPLATNQKAAAAIVQYAIELAAAQPGVQLEIKTHLKDLDKSTDELTCTPWRPTYVAELPSAVEGREWENFWEDLRLPRACTSCQGCRRLRFGNARRQHRVNWAVNKAIKLGLEVRDAETEEDLARWYELYLLTMRHNAVPPRPYRFFHSLWSSLHPIGKMRLLLAEQHNAGQTRLVAGSVLLQFGQKVFYAFTGCAPEDFGLHPHDILQIEAIRGACRSGFRWYDFGEVSEEHEALAQFKTKWGGDPIGLYRYYYPAPVARTSDGGGGRLASSARKVWRSLPAKATELLGDLIYSRM